MLTEDATERKATEARIERMARFDELTGLANRFEYNTNILEAFARRERTGEPFALLYVDLDGFKQVNDSLGHDIGDRVLIETANRLRAAIRSHDVLARFGGDEFLLILPSANHAVVTTIGQRMIDAMSQVLPDRQQDRLRHRQHRHRDGARMTVRRRPTCCAMPTPRSTRPRTPAATR